MDGEEDTARLPNLSEVASEPPELTLPSRLSGASEYTVPASPEITAVREPEFRASQRKPRPQRDAKQRSRRRIIMALVAVAVLVVLIVPSIFAVTTAMADYSSLKALGLDGVEHLVAAKDDLTGVPLGHGGSSACSAVANPTATVSSSSGSSTNSLTLPTAAELQSAQTELKAAQSDFKALQVRMAHPDWVLGAGGAIPGVKSDVTEVTALANTGYDISAMGIELINAVSPVLNGLHGHALGSEPLVTQTDLNNLQHAVDNSLTLLSDVKVQLSHINVSSLPICAAEKAEFSKLSGELPKVQHLLTQGSQLIQPIGSVLGVGQPSHFLVQTLDDTELRPTGGFTGEFGILTINNGKIGTPILYNVDLIDYRAPAFGGFTNNWNLANGAPFGRAAPTPYNWWEIPNWGLRDSNLNADFPTDAKLVMGVFKDEATDPRLVSQGSQQLDGLIDITPTAIANVLKVTGPLYVPGYNVTVTAQNLVSEIHYFQLTAAGQAENLRVYPHDKTIANARKRFAQTVAHLLEQKIPALPLSELEGLAKQALVDIQAHNIGVYLTNQTLENMLITHDAAGQITSPSGVDGVAVVHTNWSAGKVNSHVRVNQVDNVTLDNKGGATHHMTIAVNDYYAPDPTGDFVTYYDYVRVYVPPTAKLLSASGFMCVTPKCSSVPYPGGQMVCQGGHYNPGPRTYTRLGSDRDPKLYYSGYPTETTSDVPGRAMWGGNIVVPMGCTATITLSWYVPNIAATSTSTHPAGSTLPYALLVQREGGTFYALQVTLHPASKVPSEGAKAVTYNVTSDTDYTFTFGEAPQPPPPAHLP